MEAADAKALGKEAPEAPKFMQYEATSTSTSQSPMKSSSKYKQSKSANQSSIFMSDPSSKQALAAEKRLAQKKSNKTKNIQERKNRTNDLLFGDGLKIKEDDMNYNNNDAASNQTNSAIYKSEKHVPKSANKTATAALQRFGKQKSNKIVNSKDRKARTMQLLHGDGALQSQDEKMIKAAPRQRTYTDDIDPDVADVHQSILNLNNCNAHDQMPPTAKLLRKVVTNLLSAENVADQEKFGKLRLTNKKIKAAFVDMEYGLETLQSLGFVRQKILNEKIQQMDDYMVFDFGHINHKALIHVMDLLNEYYPEQ